MLGLAQSILMLPEQRTNLGLALLNALGVVDTDRDDENLSEEDANRSSQRAAEH